MEKVYKYTCPDCGKEVERERYRPPHRRRCDECAYQRVNDSIQQLIDQQGPYYEKWKRGRIAAARRIVNEQSNKG